MIMGLKILKTNSMKAFPILLITLLVSNSDAAQSCLPEGIFFSQQNQINSFQTNYPGCSRIEGDLTLSGYNITNLNGLNALTSIGGSLKIECNEALTSLNGLENLTSIGEDLYLVGNLIITNMSGLQNLSYIGRDFQLSNNVAISSLTGMEGLTTIGGNLWIDNNNLLTNMMGLTHLTSIGNFVRIYANNTLENLTGLGELTSIGGNLIIGGCDHMGGLGNPTLTGLTGLQHLTSINGILEIGYNTTLTSLEGLDNIDAASVSRLYIYNNDDLSDCAVQSICDFLAKPNGTIVIENNNSGCNSKATVETTCTRMSLEEKNTDKRFLVYPNPTSYQVIIEIPIVPVNCQFSVFNLNGRKLFSYPIHESRTVIDNINLPLGIYFVCIKDQTSVKTLKLIRK
jgi:hypothetical protein